MLTPIAFENVAPVMPVRDLQAALERYRQLGFDVRAYGHDTGYGFAQRGAVSIHLSEWRSTTPSVRGQSLIFTFRMPMPSERNGPVAELRVVSARRAILSTECGSSVL